MARLALGLTHAYQGKRVLVTGHTGFKGSWLGLWLCELGAEVCGFALAAPTPSHFASVALGRRIHHVEGDIRDRAAVDAAFRAFGPEIVFHLAAQPLVRESYRAPAATFDVNVGGTVSVLEAVRECASVRSVVVVTSDKCYENREWDFAYRENDPLGGHDPYSASKAAAEVVAHSYRRSFFSQGSDVALATARAGNVIGGGDWAADRLVPDCVRALVAGAPLLVRNPSSVRPWQHVLEPLRGYLLLGGALGELRHRVPEAFNFGPKLGPSVTAHQVATEFLSAWPEASIEVPPPERAEPHEARMLRLASERAADYLGWVAELSAQESVEWTVDWYRRWFTEGRAEGAMLEHSIAQIHAYLARLSSH
ncbi:MAG: CDP-glucose 4,6-dehydratase [Polyangiaceae bacterium]|nr:CDP-glucose 4,6-dehydratase [Polyangiaceae bacterium]